MDQNSSAGKDGSTAKPTVTALQPKAQVNPVTARILEYRASAIRRKDPLAAVIGAENAALLRLSQQYGPLLEKALANVKSLADLQELDGPVARRIGLAKQIELFARLDTQLTKANASGNAKEAAEPAAAGSSNLSQPQAK
jgi:hypothetical protein